MHIDPALDPQWSADGLLSVLVDGRRFDAHVEDERLIVHGVVIDGKALPQRGDFIVRIDASATVVAIT